MTPDVRGTHQVWVTTLLDDDVELRAGDDVIIDPTPSDVSTTAGRWERYEMLCDTTGLEGAP